jgi:aconitate hydratase
VTTLFLIIGVVIISGRDQKQIAVIEAYLKAVKMFRDYGDASQDPVYTQVVELDLAAVVPSMSGPKRPHDRVAVEDVKEDFQRCLSNKVSHAISYIMSYLKFFPFMLC